MKCPFCGSLITKVVDKRAVASLGEIRRRRECLKCIRRFTTYERVASLELLVIKKDGRKEVFDLDKLRRGVGKALEKRPDEDRTEEIVTKVERKIRRKGKGEITTKSIGLAVLSELKKLDKVAYLRFASVYRRFENPEDFARELQGL